MADKQKQKPNKQTNHKTELRAARDPQPDQKSILAARRRAAGSREPLLVTQIHLLTSPPRACPPRTQQEIKIGLYEKISIKLYIDTATEHGFTFDIGLEATHTFTPTNRDTMRGNMGGRLFYQPRNVSGFW